MIQEVERVYEEPPTRGRQFIYAFSSFIAVAFVCASRQCFTIAPVVVIAIVKENRSNDSGIGINDTMAMWLEELRRQTLFDGEAELTPESRPVWQQNMELRTKFVRYPGPKLDGLHPTHFWFLEHYGLLPYFLQMQAEGIPAKVFFSIVSTCRYVTVAERTEHLELRGLTGRKLVVSPEVVREAFGIPRDAAHDEEQGATWPNQAPREPAGVPLQIINDYLLCKAGSGPTPSRRYNLPAAPAQPRPRKRRAPTSSSAPARETQTATRPTKITRTTTEPEVGVVPSPPREVQEISSSSSPEQPPRKEPWVGEPPQQAKGRQGDTAIPGFEPSDDKLPIGTLRRDISRLRQEVQRTEPLVIREALNGSRQRAIEQIPLPPPGQKKKKNKTPAVQSGPERNSSAQPPAREQRAAPATVEEERPDIGPRYTDEEVRRLHPELFVQLGPAPPTAGVPQPIPVEKTLLDRLAEISRPEAMSGIVEEDQAVRDVVRDPDLPCIVPGETVRSFDGPLFGTDGSRGQALDHGESGRQDRCFNQRQAIGCDAG
ncbi:hypothetical protein R1flu_025678 [Riccia fluitans]|uniref:Uncharacterized protein n=1 Tax=Riccia fluitans TaxID=41844 RepID=A0ABD1XYF8_9MARC